MMVRRMDNVLIVVNDLEAVKAFFVELGLKVEGESTVEGPLVGKLIGLENAPVNTLGIRRVMFAVEGIDAVVEHMRAQGAEVIGEMQYEDAYRLAYLRGPEGIIVGLAEALG